MTKSPALKKSAANQSRLFVGKILDSNDGAKRMLILTP